MVAHDPPTDLSVLRLVAPDLTPTQTVLEQIEIGFRESPELGRVLTLLLADVVEDPRAADVRDAFEVDQDELAAGAESAGDRGDAAARVFEVVVDVAHERGVDRCAGEPDRRGRAR